MGDIRNILTELWKKVVVVYKEICALSVRIYKKVIPSFQKAWEACCNGVAITYDKVVGASLRRKTFIGMTMFLTTFFLWQMFAYSLSQTVFVIVNLIFVALSSTLICVIIFSTRKNVRELEEQLETAVSLRKKKEKEISSLKMEIHNYKIAAKNQTSFGKNSQALIDSVKKNKQEQRAGEARGQYIMRSIALHYEVCCGMIYMKNAETGNFDLEGHFALSEEPKYTTITTDDGLAGMAIEKGKVQVWKDVPVDYFNISSGLGETKSLQLYILPLKKNGEVEAIVEVASFSKLPLADIWPDIDNILLNN